MLGKGDASRFGGARRGGNHGNLRKEVTIVDNAQSLVVEEAGELPTNSAALEETGSDPKIQQIRENLTFTKNMLKMCRNQKQSDLMKNMEKQLL